MIHHIEGILVEKTPTHVVIECNGIGYMIHVSLQTYSKITGKDKCRLYTYLAIREDAHTLYGFSDIIERDVFKSLISVSGVGASTARMILSALSPSEIQEAIATGNVAVLKSVKGIGEKSAQRIIVDLKGKLGKDISASSFLSGTDNTLKNEALTALIRLGFVKNIAEKAIEKALASGQPTSTVESLIKQALKQL